MSFHAPSVLVASLLASAAAAQCLGAPSGAAATLLPTTSFYTVSDEGLTVPSVPLGFVFPMAGAPRTIDRIYVSSNGEIYLTDGNYGLLQPTDYGITYLDELRGFSSIASPRIAAFGSDLDFGTNSAWQVAIDQSVPGQCRVTWVDVWLYSGGSPTGSFNISCTLYASGEIDVSYDSATALAGSTPYIVGVSIGGGVGSFATPESDLSGNADSGTLGLLYQTFDPFFGNPFDLAGTTVRFSPNGIGGFTSNLICAGARNDPYGSGCYDYVSASQAIYEYFPDGPSSSAGLTGNSVRFNPLVTGYLVTWGGGAWIAPTGGANQLFLTDDSEADITPSLAFPTISGAVPTVSVCSNGFVNMGPSGSNPVWAYGSVYELLNAFVPSFRSNADYDPGVTGSISWEEVPTVGGTLLVVSYIDLVRYFTTQDTDRFQFQLNLNTGEVLIVWDLMTATTPFGGTVVGYSPAGPSNDPGSISLATGTPAITSPDTVLQPLALSASPDPVFTLGGPTVPVTYTATNVVDVAPPFGVGITLLMFSVAPFPGGLDMGFLGMPGCNLNILSLDVTVPMSGTAPTATATLSIPQPLAPGVSFYSQALSLFAANSLPNGQNAFGGVLSNGVRSLCNLF